MYGRRKTNARYPSTPPLTVETLGETISSSTGPGKEIAGLNIQNMIMMMMMTKVVKLFRSVFSLRKLEPGKGRLGLCEGRKGS